MHFDRLLFQKEKHIVDETPKAVEEKKPEPQIVHDKPEEKSAKENTSEKREMRDVPRPRTSVDMKTLEEFMSNTTLVEELAEVLVMLEKDLAKTPSVEKQPIEAVEIKKESSEVEASTEKVQKEESECGKLCVCCV